ncbi:MAG: putative sulfate exporter family transporter [Bacteroidales bacterium]
MSKFLNQFKNEDWIATIMGAVLILLVALIPLLTEANSTPLYYGIAKLIAIGTLSYIGIRILGTNMVWFIPSFLFLYGISFLGEWIASIALVKRFGFESVFFSVAIGLIIRNVFGLPEWLKPAVRSEFYIKGGLVLLGTSILFKEIMTAGSLGMIQAIVVILAVWYFSFWLSKKMGVDTEMGVLLSTAVSICGVSAAIAANGAMKGNPKKLSFVISLVLVVAIPMMYLMPYLSNLLGLSPEVAGAWLGGTIDTTGAVVASGKFLGETAEKYSVIIKSAQNALLGVAAFAISIYWTLRDTNKDSRPSPSVLWERFPKFVLGFIAASILFSFILQPEAAKALVKPIKALRETLFSIAFVAIGLETDFKKIFNKENSRFTATFLLAQTFNIIVTLVVAWILFRNIA